jgi:hypothetical protein
VDVVIRVFPVTSTPSMAGAAGRLEQLSLNTQAQSVCVGVDA